MKSLYSFNNDSIERLLRNASDSSGATLVIPDLQRPFVWSPPDVVLLVDSLLRGFPFGTLLLWDVADRRNSTIPSLGFRQVVDGADGNDKRVNQVDIGKPFKLVLDGQQRLQSLLLAFGGDGWGYRLVDSDWADYLRRSGQKGAKGGTKQWSLGQLCLNVAKFDEQIHSSREVDYPAVMTWAVMNPQTHQSPKGRGSYHSPLPVATELDQGILVRLSDLYRLACDSGLSSFPDLQEGLVKSVFQGTFPRRFSQKTLNGLTTLVDAIRRFAETQIHYLNVNERRPDQDQSSYNNSVITIFTRLNTAGRTLTQEEVVFAWIKVGWTEAGAERSAYAAFEKLLTELEEAGFGILMDDLVNLVASAWAVYYNKGVPFTKDDFRNGDKLKAMAVEISREWDLFEEVFIEAARYLHHQGYWGLRFGAQYKSKNSAYVIFCWMLLGRRWVANRELPTMERSAALTAIQRLVLKYAVRFLSLSQWADEWSEESSFAKYLGGLSDILEPLAKCSTVDDVVRVLEERMLTWLSPLVEPAVTEIAGYRVTKQNQVTNYQPMLWVWHRLNAERWSVSSTQLRLADVKASRASEAGLLNPEVDHCVSHAYWLERVKLETVDDDNAADLRNERVELINDLGNCSLLAKGFNISKGTKTFADFFPKLVAVADGSLTEEVFRQSLRIDETLFAPAKKSLEDIEAAIAGRSAAIKAEIQAYVRGELDLVEEAKPPELRKQFA